jgi:hypothetical protein
VVVVVVSEVEGDSEEEEDEEVVVVVVALSVTLEEVFWSDSRLDGGVDEGGMSSWGCCWELERAFDKSFPVAAIASESNLLFSASRMRCSGGGGRRGGGGAVEKRRDRGRKKDPCPLFTAKRHGRQKGIGTALSSSRKGFVRNGRTARRKAAWADIVTWQCASEVLRT